MSELRNPTSCDVAVCQFSGGEIHNVLRFKMSEESTEPFQYRRKMACFGKLTGVFSSTFFLNPDIVPSASQVEFLSTVDLPGTEVQVTFGSW